MFIWTIIKTLRNKERVAAGEIEVPIAESLRDPQETPAWLDSWKPWLAGTVALILLAYGPQIYLMLRDMQLTSPGFSTLTP